MPKSVTIACPSCEQDVLGLDVAMDDAVRVRVGECLGDLAGDAQRFVDRQLPSRDERSRSDSPSTSGMHVVEQRRPASPESSSGRMCG